MQDVKVVNIFIEYRSIWERKKWKLRENFLFFIIFYALYEIYFYTFMTFYTKYNSYR